MNKSLILILFFATFLWTSCDSSRKNFSCDNFKTGRFELHSEFNNSTSIIDRDDSIQTETNTLTGHIVKAKIKWTDKCEYELIYVEQTLNSSDTIVPLIQSKSLNTKILKATKDYYVFQSSMEGINNILIDTLKVIK